MILSISISMLFESIFYISFDIYYWRNENIPLENGVFCQGVGSLEVLS